MFSSRTMSLVLRFAAILCFLVLSASGESGGLKPQDGGYPVATFYVA